MEERSDRRKSKFQTFLESTDRETEAKCEVRDDQQDGNSNTHRCTKLNFLLKGWTNGGAASVCGILQTRCGEDRLSSFTWILFALERVLRDGDDGKLVAVLPFAKFDR